MTVMPLFVSHLTDSAIDRRDLDYQQMDWRLPQILTIPNSLLIKLGNFLTLLTPSQNRCIFIDNE
jgi:hypothetical protein